MTEGNNNYMQTLLGGGIQETSLESKRLAQKLADDRMRDEQDRIHALNRKAADEARARDEAAAQAKREALQAETDAIAQAKLDEEKRRAKREYRGVMGTDAGFAEYWKATAHERASAKISKRNAKVPTARDVLDGNIGPRATFTPVQFPR